MADNMNGDQMRAEAQRVSEQAKAAGTAAGDTLRDSARSAAEQARSFRDQARTAADQARARARDASEWARARFEDLQGRVEDRPQAAALWALGIGVVAGILFGSLLRGRD